MEQRLSTRDITENVYSGEHLKLKDLKDRAGAANIYNQYLYKTKIPAFPRPEFHVSHLQHDTDAVGLTGIKRDGGFKDPGKRQGKYYLLWWSLAVKPDDITSAERRLLAETYPDRTEAQDQAQAQRSFLGMFATSPAFLKTSMFGSYRFTLPVEDVLEAYREQFCSGAPPVMRVYETVLYKQKVMYVVLVHSPGVQEFNRYPVLSEDPEAICRYQDGHFIWRSQAMCETHRYNLVQRPEIQQMEVQQLSQRDIEFYVWDCVAIVLHMEKDKVLTFDRDRLRQTLTLCKEGARSLTPDGFQSFEDATEIVKNLWPDHPGPLEKERSLQETRSSD